MGNPNHDERGRFSSGRGAAARGDHLGAMPADKSMRHVPGHGVVPRSQPVTRLTSAATERVALNRRVDEGHFPTESDADVGMKTALSGPRGIAPGKLDPRVSTLVSAGPGKPRVRVRANNATTNAAMAQSSRPSPRTQPSAAQLIGAGVIKGN